ncbi:hypothetical protein V8C42DRAFT_338724 [Trichoderma barbatum]
MVLSNEAHGHHEKALQLTQQFYDANDGQEARLSIDDYQIHWACGSDATLLHEIPRQKRLEMLISGKLSPACRLMVSKSLRDAQGEYKIVRLKKDSNELQVHQDVLCFWSKYFDAAFSGRWAVSDVYDLDPDSEFSLTSLFKVFEGFFYTGSYQSGSNEDYMMEKKIADYFRIEGLIL